MWFGANLLNSFTLPSFSYLSLFSDDCTNILGEDEDEDDGLARFGPLQSLFVKIVQDGIEDNGFVESENVVMMESLLVSKMLIFCSVKSNISIL